MIVYCEDCIYCNKLGYEFAKCKSPKYNRKVSRKEADLYCSIVRGYYTEGDKDNPDCFVRREEKIGWWKFWRKKNESK